MRLIFFTLLLLSINSFGQKVKAKDCFKYPKEISKLKLQDNYDNSRWILFNWIGAETYIDEIYFGQMELLYKGISSRIDTTDIFFGFYFRDSTKAKKNQMTLVANATVSFKLSTNQCFWAFVYPFAAPSRGLKFGDSLLEAKLSIETKDFLKQKTEIINKCFLEIARKRKIID
jgi:hypothetical protein